MGRTKGLCATVPAAPWQEPGWGQDAAWPRHNAVLWAPAESADPAGQAEGIPQPLSAFS